jgi:hypothetical protein
MECKTKSDGKNWKGDKAVQNEQRKCTHQDQQLHYIQLVPQHLLRAHLIVQRWKHSGLVLGNDDGVVNFRLIQVNIEEKARKAIVEHVGSDGSGAEEWQVSRHDEWRQRRGGEEGYAGDGD